MTEDKNLTEMLIAAGFGISKTADGKTLEAFVYRNVLDFLVRVFLKLLLHNIHYNSSIRLMDVNVWGRYFGYVSKGSTCHEIFIN